MKNVLINNVSYKIVKDYKEAFDLEEVTKLLTDYFNDFDYILGDWAYGKLRLKGFNEKGNPNFKPINDYEKLNDYLDSSCAYGCKYFILHKIKD